MHDSRTELAQMQASMRALQAQLDAEREAARKDREVALQRIAQLEQERENLRASHERLRLELELWKRKLFIAKAERADDEKQLRLEYEQKVRELDALAGTLGLGKHEERPASQEPLARDGKRRGKRGGNRGTGRRKLQDLPLEEERIEIADPHLEQLVAESKVVRHGFEDTYKLAHKRATKVRLCVSRVRYKAVDVEGNADVITTAMPSEMLPSSIVAPSLASHVIMENVGKGMPLFRIEDTLRREGVAIDRGTLSRIKKLIGDALTLTVVKAMLEHGRKTAFCISTDATGVCIQPIYNEQGSQPCKKGHFLVMIADREHIVFEYLEKETGPAIYERFRGFEGYVQADAKAVFNLLFADAAELDRKAPDVEHDGRERVEVGCWYHCRRRFWEAAVAKDPIGREGLVRLGRIFELEGSWQDKPPSEIKRLRERHLRPHVESFFAWVDEQRPFFKDQRGLARTALEYARNQHGVLVRFFEDGRLVLTNNGAERAIKAIALGRKAWLFCGSDDHAKSTAALYSLVASARLHSLDPEDYLRCLIRLAPLWPKDRMLELSPLFWARTRRRLDTTLLAQDLGPIPIPTEPLDTSITTPQEQAASS